MLNAVARHIAHAELRSDVSMEMRSRLSKISDCQMHRRAERLPDWIKPSSLCRYSTRAGSRLVNDHSDKPAVIHSGQHRPTSAPNHVIAIAVNTERLGWQGQNIQVSKLPTHESDEEAEKNRSGACPAKSASVSALYATNDGTQTNYLRLRV